MSYFGRPEAVSLSPVAVTARFSPTMAFDTNARVEYDVNGNGLQSFSTGGTRQRPRRVGQSHVQPQPPHARPSDPTAS